MSDSSLSKKERYDLNKKEEIREHTGTQRTHGLKKAMVWIGFFAVIIAAIWGLVKIQPASIQNGTIIGGVAPGDWVKGNKESAVVLIEYGDFQCPACGVYYPFVKRLIDEHSNSFQFVYRHFPLSQHSNARPAAYASEAAGKQGKFWDMYDLIFAHQNDWAEKSNKDAEGIFLRYATAMSLNTDQFKKDRDSQGVKDAVDQDYGSGVSNNVSATPTFFLNGKKIQPRSYDEFVGLISQSQPAVTQSSVPSPNNSR